MAQKYLIYTIVVQFLVELIWMQSIPASYILIYDTILFCVQKNFEYRIVLNFDRYLICWLAVLGSVKFKTDKYHGMHNLAKYT